MTSAEQTATFCSALFGGPGGTGDDRLSGQRAYLWTVSSGEEAKKRTHWFPADRPETIASAASSLAKAQPGTGHIYVGTGLLSAADAAEKGPHGRATNKLTSGLLGVAVDIDILGGVHQSKPYPPDRAAADRIWQAVNLPPTMIVHTGGGLHVWWLFNEIWLTEDATGPGGPSAERDAMYALARDWSATLRYHADRLGSWKIDSTFDLARVLRVPGTRNVRGDFERPVQLEHYDCLARYEPGDIEAAMVDPTVLSAYGTGIEGGTGQTVAALAGVDLTKVWARVTSTAYVANRYEPEWLSDMLEILPGSTLEAVWRGDHTVTGDPSPSGVDASLVRCLIETRHATTERLVEAVMCRRLRSGEKLEKVDPARRTDYLVRTIVKITALAERDAKRRAERDGASAALVTQAAAGAREPAPTNGMRSAPPDEPDTITEAILLDLDSEPARAPEPAGTAAPPVVPPAAPPEPAAEPVAGAPPVDQTTVLVPPKPTVTGPLWTPRGPKLVAAMELLDDLLIPAPYRERGVAVWLLEYRDFGEAQRGRMMLHIPAHYDWPADNMPPTYRPGRPLHGGWYKRDAFDTPKGYRWTLIRDALMSANPVTGTNKDAWSNLIDSLVPYWQRDSSGSDMVSQMHEWLLDYLVGHPATLTEGVAVDNRRAWLRDHAEWGTLGAPTVYVNVTSFLEYVGRQQGGMTGRSARTLLGYVDLVARRPRMVGFDGIQRRQANWWQVGDGEFTAHEWREILEAARDSMEAAEQRGMRLLRGGA
jgi:hypothetical protein